MKRYAFLRLMSVLLMAGGIIFGTLILAMVFVAQSNEVGGIIAMGVSVILGGVTSGAYLDMQIDNARNNAATALLLAQLAAKKKGKD